jgi:large subunit ribosomal protein L15
MKISELKPQEGSTKKRKRIGRGPGSGHGTTATKGNKGQKARSGGLAKAGFEGGQMPLMRRIPKRGFKNPFRKEYAVVNVGDLEAFKGKEKVTVQDFIDAGSVKKIKNGIKLLSGGEIDFAITVTVHKASQKAIEKIREKGGHVEVLL